MRTQLKKAFHGALSKLRIFPVELTPKVEVVALIESLRPQSTDKPLIRLGPNGDAGYVVPDDLAGITACFSPGVSFVSDFEDDCAKLGMEVFMADKSVDGPAVQNDAFRFVQKYIGSFTNEEFMTMDEWAASYKNTDSDLLLQIDIEGYEYEVFLNMTMKLQNRFRIIVAEFHGLDQLWNRPYYTVIRRVFEKLLQTHVCVHLHPNNCSGVIERYGVEIPKVMEFTFLRKDRAQLKGARHDFPHALDFDNTKNPTLVLPEFWHKDKVT